MNSSDIAFMGIDMDIDAGDADAMIYDTRGHIFAEMFRAQMRRIGSPSASPESLW